MVKISKLSKTYTDGKRQTGLVGGRVCTSQLEIQRSVRQRYVLSPLLFILYADKIFKEATEDLEAGIKINGVQLKTIKYS